MENREIPEGWREETLVDLLESLIDYRGKTTDWNKRDDIRASLRLLVKKILMRYGYPPDVARMKADRVLEQSELLASELSE